MYINQKVQVLQVFFWLTSFNSLLFDVNNEFLLHPMYIGGF